MRYRLRMLLALVASVAFSWLLLYFSAYDPRTDSLVGTWRASVRAEIDEAAAAIPILWRLNANGTAQYGHIPGDTRDGKWRLVLRQGNKRIMRYELPGQVGIQIFILEGLDQFTLISDVEGNGNELISLNELPVGGLVFHRVKE